MKKICGKKLAFLLAACVLAAGTFVSCGEKETEEPTAADSLAKPTGNDPFTKAEYRAVITSTYIDKDGESKEYDGTYYCVFDTKERIITVYEDEEKTLDNNTYQKKYTYDTNSKTVTLAYYALAIPTDIDAYVSWEIADTEEYTGKWKFGSKNDFIDGYLQKSYDTHVAKLEKRIADKKATGDDYKGLQKQLDDMPNQWKKAVAKLDKQFDEAITYDYSKDGNVITLTNANADPKKLVLTPASN